eukprot:gene14630-17303_t
MTEERFTELLSRKLAGEISPSELTEFKGYISANASYGKQYESLKGYWKQNDESYENIGKVFEKIKNQTDIPGREAEGQQQIKIPRFNFSWVTKVAAVFLVFGVLAVLYHFTLSRFFSAEDTVYSWKQIQVPNRLISSITLPDGTKVTLNSASKLKYPESFKGSNREVYLSGEAFFDVVSDHQHPFIVHTEKMKIKVLGTAFNIRSYANDREKQTTLLRGSIQVTFPDNPATVMLKPKDKILIKDGAYELGTQTYYNEAEGSLMETLWMSNKLAFRNESFESLANDLERKYGVKIIFNKNSIRDFKFSGEFEKENLEQALLSLKIVTPFNYKIKGNSVYLY